jgi:nucleoside-diphosphate-sugar epimerase
LRRITFTVPLSIELLRSTFACSIIVSSNFYNDYFYFYLQHQKTAMPKEKILVIGASGQIGVELTLALRKIYGNPNVIASDLREENELLKGTGPYVSLDVMNKEMLHVQVIRQNVTQIYLLAAILSATGEKNPHLAWNLNMQGLLNVLDIAREEKLTKSILAKQYRSVWPDLT